IIGLLRTRGLQGRENDMRLWGPPGCVPILDAAVNLGVDRVPFPVRIGELQPGSVLSRDGYVIRVFRTNHWTPSVGSALVELDRRGRYHPDTARGPGGPPGPP